MIGEVPRSLHFSDPKEDGFLYTIDGRPLANLIPHDDVPLFALFWRGRVRLNTMFEFVSVLADEAASIHASRSDRFEYVRATYIIGDSLREFDLLTDELQDSQSEHRRFADQNQDRLRFARFDFVAKEPVILWADLVQGWTDADVPTEAGFGGGIAPDSVFQFLRYSVRENLTERDHADLQEKIQRRVTQFTDCHKFEPVLA